MKINLIGGEEIEHDGGRLAGLFNVQVKLDDAQISFTVSENGEYWLSAASAEKPTGQEIVHGNYKDFLS